jgi:hypothetical protein
MGCPVRQRVVGAMVVAAEAVERVVEVRVVEAAATAMAAAMREEGESVEEVAAEAETEAATAVGMVVVEPVAVEVTAAMAAGMAVVTAEVMAEARVEVRAVVKMAEAATVVGAVAVAQIQFCRSTDTGRAESAGVPSTAFRSILPMSDVLHPCCDDHNLKGLWHNPRPSIPTARSGVTSFPLWGRFFARPVMAASMVVQGQMGT